MMPNMDGIEACMNFREDRNMLIIMLSAKSEDIDKIQGLASGTDDYLSKPFNPLELIARVKSQLRRFKKYNTSIEHNKSIHFDLLGLISCQWLKKRNHGLTPFR